MATYDRTLGTASAQSAAESRLGRRLQIDWSAIFAGSALGWGALFLFSVLGAAIGFAAIDPYAIRSGDSASLASGIWGAAAMILSSFLGAYVVVRVAGDRRRGEGLLHGAISWGLSMIAFGLLALFAASAAATAAGPIAAHEVRARTVRSASGPVVTTAGRNDRARLEDGAENAAQLAGLAGGGAVLALVASLLGALVAASRQSGVPLAREFRLGSLARNQRTGEPLQHSSSVLLTDRGPQQHDERARHEQTTILPPQ